MRKLIIGLIAGAVLAAGGVAYATIPDAGGIHGCYGPNGQLRVIDPSAGGKCNPSETSLQWNQTGPQGPAGPSAADFWITYSLRSPGEVGIESQHGGVTLVGPVRIANDGEAPPPLGAVTPLTAGGNVFHFPVDITQCVVTANATQQGAFLVPPIPPEIFKGSDLGFPSIRPATGDNHDITLLYWELEPEVNLAVFC